MFFIGVIAGVCLGVKFQDEIKNVINNTKQWIKGE